MPSNNLPTNVDVDLENGGTIKYANEVIAIIAGVAAGEVDGIAGMCTSGGISDKFGRNRNITRGVKIELAGEEASVELYIIVEYGSPIQKVASEVQENVRKAIETMTGLHVLNVDVHVQGVSFEREKKAAQAGFESAHLGGEETVRIPEPAKEEKPAAKEAPATEEFVDEEPLKGEVVLDEDDLAATEEIEEEAENEAPAAVDGEGEATPASED